jgi:ubiquitin-protein ligase
MAYTLPVGLYLTSRTDGSRGWNGVIFVHQGPYEEGVFKFRIDFPKIYSTPVVMFTPSQVYNPYV